MGGLAYRHVARLAIALGAGILLGRTAATGPGSGSVWIPQFRVLQGETSSSTGDQRTASSAPRYWSAFSFLQPVRISLRAPIGSRALETSMTGAIAAGYIPGGTAPAVAPAPEAANVPSTVAPVDVSARAPDRATMAKPLASSSDPGDDDAPGDSDAHGARSTTRLAYAASPVEGHQDRGDTRRQSEANLGSPIIIGHTLQDNEGGDVEEFAAKYKHIRKSGRKVEIDGACVSACTLVASLPKDQVCVTPRASLGVHLASDADDGRIDPQYTDWAVKTYYPKALQDWIRAHGGLREEPKFVKGRDLLAIFDACKKGA
jgi:hypothetical protein